MRIGSSEWREEMGRAAAGKTIASLAWETDEDGDNGYWLMRFEDGSEVCWSESMAEAEARQEERIEEERTTKERITRAGWCCRYGEFNGRAVLPAGWSLRTPHGGAMMCGECGAIHRLTPQGWTKEPAPGSTEEQRNAAKAADDLNVVNAAIEATPQVVTERLTQGWRGGPGGIVMGGTPRIPSGGGAAGGIIPMVIGGSIAAAPHGGAGGFGVLTPEPPSPMAEILAKAAATPPDENGLRCVVGTNGAVSVVALSDKQIADLQSKLPSKPAAPCGGCGGSGRTLRLWFVTGKQEMGTCSECHGTGTSGDGVQPGSITIVANKVVNTGTIGGEGDEVLRVEGPDVFKPKA